jgi:hypothetical protein
MWRPNPWPEPTIKAEPTRSIVSQVAPAASAAGADPMTAGAPPKQHFRPPAELPTQVGPDGVRFDFNSGARVALPETGGPWRIRLSDLDTGNILYETTLDTGWVNQRQTLLFAGAYRGYVRRP